MKRLTYIDVKTVRTVRGPTHLKILRCSTTVCGTVAAVCSGDVCTTWGTNCSQWEGSVKKSVSSDVCVTSVAKEMLY